MKVEHIGSAPFLVRVFLWVLVLAGVLALSYVLVIRNVHDGLHLAQQEEVRLKTDFLDKQSKAASLSALREQQVEIEESIGQLLRQLPNETEVPGLLVDISQEGLGAGLEIESFEPQPERQTDYYVELPIRIRVFGDYDKFGRFVDGVAKLPRIVTIQEIKLTKKGEHGSGGQVGLVMDALAKTYRSLPQE